MSCESAVLVAVAAGFSYKDVGAGVGRSVGWVFNVVQAERMRKTLQGRDRFRPAVGSLNDLDREQIMAGVLLGWSNSRIGDAIGFHRSTVWREIDRNGGREQYSAVAARARAVRVSARPKPFWTVSRPWLWDVVLAMLADAFSPQQISRRLRRDHAGDPQWWVSHESIYQAIYVQARGELRKELARFLRTGRQNRKPHKRATQAARAKRSAPIVGMVNISERPAEIEDRALPGHWEGDLIIGLGGHTAIATLVERTTRFGMLIKLDSKAADHVADRLAWAAEQIPEMMIKSLTWDQGTEMAAHHKFTVKTGLPVYFCDPASPWQRGSNENWNGLVRQYLPKGMSFANVTQSDLNEISASLNRRPRMTLDWDTPTERLEQLTNN